MYLTEYLRGRRVWFKHLLHAPASSAGRLAASLRVPGRRVAKAVLVRAGEQEWLAVLPATSRIDPARLATALGVPVSELRLATPEEVARRFPTCEPGAPPAVGRLFGVATVVDPSLEGPEIVFPGHTRLESFLMRSSDYLALEEPIRAEFAVPIAAPAVRSAPSRRAG
jgi:Ala-tRNA(Pro) deacylase